jgi:hypothetical protein
MLHVCPDRIEYRTLSGDLLSAFPFPYGHETNTSYCLSLAQWLLSRNWRKESGQLVPSTKIKPHPELVRVVDENGKEICQWSIVDQQRI